MGNWQGNIRRTLELAPDSVTIYQMELPFNTVYSQDILGHKIETPVADWPTKRAWVDYAFDELLAAGYHVSSAYTLVKDPAQGQLQLPRQPVARGRHAGHRASPVSATSRACTTRTGPTGRSTSTRC